MELRRLELALGMWRRWCLAQASLETEIDRDRHDALMYASQAVACRALVGLWSRHIAKWLGVALGRWQASTVLQREQCDVLLLTARAVERRSLGRHLGKWRLHTVVAKEEDRRIEQVFNLSTELDGACERSQQYALRELVQQEYALRSLARCLHRTCATLLAGACRELLGRWKCEVARRRDCDDALRAVLWTLSRRVCQLGFCSWAAVTERGRRLDQGLRHLARVGGQRQDRSRRRALRQWQGVVAYGKAVAMSGSLLVLSGEVWERRTHDLDLCVMFERWKRWAAQQSYTNTAAATVQARRLQREKRVALRRWTSAWNDAAARTAAQRAFLASAMHRYLHSAWDMWRRSARAYAHKTEDHALGGRILYYCLERSVVRRARGALVALWQAGTRSAMCAAIDAADQVAERAQDALEAAVATSAADMLHDQLGRDRALAEAQSAGADAVAATTARLTEEAEKAAASAAADYSVALGEAAAASDAALAAAVAEVRAEEEGRTRDRTATAARAAAALQRWRDSLEDQEREARRRDELVQRLAVRRARAAMRAVLWKLCGGGSDRCGRSLLEANPTRRTQLRQVAAAARIVTVDHMRQVGVSAQQLGTAWARWRTCNQEGLEKETAWYRLRFAYLRWERNVVWGLGVLVCVAAYVVWYLWTSSCPFTWRDVYVT